MKDLIARKQEISKKYGIDFEQLEKEQLKLAKELTIKDKIDFSLIERYGAFDNLFIKNKILSCLIVCNKEFEIVDKSYIFEKVKFPYFPGFRAYRELQSMLAAFEKLKEKPDVVFINALGITHPRLGLASHFGLMANIPTIGVTNSLFECETNGKDGDNILKNGKVVGRVLIGKLESKPLYVSPGNNISVKSSYEISRQLIIPPHKRPEPLHLASKYAKSVRKELMVG